MPRVEDPEPSVAPPAASFPALDLPIVPPYPPMEALSVAKIPSGGGWQYEPKWDGFRCLAFRRDGEVVLQSKSGQPLTRYFPELVAALAALTPSRFVVDGEIIIVRDGQLAFDDLLQRIHPAESRVNKLAAQTPSTLVIFDLLVDARGSALVDEPLEERRPALEAFFARLKEPYGVRLSPATTSHDDAERWMRELGAAGLDGVVAKPIALPYRSGERDGMVKIKRQRTADCIVAGFRYAQKGGSIGSLLLGLIDADGRIDHVGFTSSFTKAERTELEPVVMPLRGGSGFTGRAPGGPSRWSANRSTEFESLEPTLVCEVRYDHFSGDRFRHGTKFLRWRPDKSPAQCTFDQVRPPRAGPLLRAMGID
jgi:ATP-dependent DNA ligase